MRPADQGLPDGDGAGPDQADKLASARSRSAQLRDRRADRRDQVADQRDRIADAREAAADRRDKKADEREAILDERESRLGPHRWDGLSQSGPEWRERAHESIGRSVEQVTRSAAAHARDEAAMRRDEAAWSRQARRAVRGQADLADKLARTARETGQTLLETMARSQVAVARAQAVRESARDTIARSATLREQAAGNHGSDQADGPHGAAVGPGA